MFDDNEYGTTLFRNPLFIQHEVLKEQQDRLNGNKIVADPNNSFCFLLEATSNMTANSILRTEEIQESIYPKRATTTEDLYKHMSDQDYVGMTGTPASVDMFLILNKRYLIDNALQYNLDYNKVVIPAHTVFTVGKYTFGIYYPIEIQINRNTESINVVYDTTTSNPLYTLAYNTVEFDEYKFKQLELLRLKFPIYQITRTTVTETMIKEQGFSKIYDYTDKFYAIQAYNYKNSVYTEMSYSLSETIYDVTEPTLRLSLYPEEQKVKASIPQIYFTNDLIGNKMEINILSTKGAIDVDVSAVTSDNITANFGFSHRNTTNFTTILGSIPTIEFQLDATKIIGGTDGYTYEELRSYIINDTLYETVPVTPIELTSFFAKKGLSIVKQLDNITDRIYYAHKILTDSESTILPVNNSQIRLTDTSTDDTSTLIKSIDDSITILPTTVFKSANVADYYSPLTDEELNTLTSQEPEDIAADITLNQYMRTPFHIRLITDDQYTQAESYNLMNPSCTNLTFIKDNPTISAQMTVTSMSITHDGEGSNGYIVRLGVLKQADLVNIAEENILVYILTSTVTGSTVGVRATYVGMVNTLSVYEFKLDTNYHITKNNEISVTSLYSSDGSLDTNYIDLTTSISVILAVDSAVVEQGTQDNIIVQGLPNGLSSYIGVIRQRFDCILGESLATTIINNVNVNWNEQMYEIYASDVYETYPEDVYERNPDGTLVITIVEDEVVLNKLHSEGDIVYDGEDPVVKYTAGTIKLVNGEPVLQADREIEYFIESMMFHLSLFYTDDVVYENYDTVLPALITDYAMLVGEASIQMMERTDVYFRPTNTLGNGTFSIGDGEITSLPLDLSFSVRIYVYPQVYSDSNILDMITENVESIIEDELTLSTISVVNISNTIRDTLSDYVVSVDVGGINDNINLQTLILKDEDAIPTVRQSIEYINNVYTITKAIDIAYISAE